VFVNYTTIFPTNTTDWKLLLKENFVILMLMTKSAKDCVVVTSNSAVSCEFLLIHHPSLLTPLRFRRDCKFVWRYTGIRTVKTVRQDLVRRRCLFR